MPLISEWVQMKDVTMSTRACPDCKQPFELRPFGEVMVDICSSCMGIWLDAGEFNALVSARFEGVPLEEAFDIAAISLAPRECPDGHGEMRLIDVAGAEIDICQICRGLWLEAEDREAIRDYKAPPTPLEPLSPKQDIPARPEPDNSPVPCASCQEMTTPLRALHRQDAYWCEACVVEGNYPGAAGPPVHRRIKEMALAQARYQANRQLSKDARDIRAANKDRVTYSSKGHYVTGAWTFEEYELALLRFKAWLSEARDRFRGKG